MARLAAAFAVGVALLQWQAELPPLVTAAGAAAVAAAIAALAGRSRARGARFVSRGLALFAALLTGFSFAAWRAELRLADALAPEWELRDLRIVGVVSDLPRRFERGARFSFQVESVDPPAASVPPQIMLSMYRGWHEDEWFSAPMPQAGERWRFTVRLKRPHGNVNPGGFDYEAWLLDQGVRATGYVRTQTAPERLLAEVPGVMLAIERLRGRLRDRMGAVLGDHPYAGVIVALAIGDQGSIDAEHWRIFSATGTTHLMSISGLHVTMVASLVGWLAGWLWRRSEWLTLRLPVRRAAIAAGWLAAFGYTLLAGFGVPAQRTLYMLSVAVLALWSGRATRPRQTLALALIVVLLLDPWA